MVMIIIIMNYVKSCMIWLAQPKMAAVFSC